MINQKKPRKKKCKICKEVFQPERQFQPTCSIDCAIAKSRLDQERANKKALAKKRSVERLKKKKNLKRKQKFYENDLSTRKNAAKRACHAYIRERDKDKPCICCNRSTIGKKVDAGHWLESGNNPLIRYDEDNIHAQLVYCNQYQGGDSDDYEGNLRKKIGNYRVDKLLSMKGGTLKRTAQDYKEIELYYKDKLKKLKDIE